MKLLTVSIAAYNVEKYLEKALTSLTNNSELMTLLEVIVEDDGSTDGTFAIAEEFQSKYPGTFRAVHKENGGYGSTINNSIRLAKGRYFKQLDGDDWFDTQNFYGFLAFLNNRNDDLVLTPYYNCYEDGNITLINHCKKVPSVVSDISALNLCEYLAMHELTIKTALLKDNHISITENCFYTDNEYTFLPLLYAKTVGRYHKPVYCYRLGRNGQSVSLEGIKKHYMDSLAVAEKIYSAYNDMKNDVSSIQPILMRKICYITDTVYTYYLVSGNKSISKEELKKFDAWMKKNYFDLYKMTRGVKKVRLLRMTKFSIYGLLRKKVLREWI